MILKNSSILKVEESQKPGNSHTAKADDATLPGSNCLDLASPKVQTWTKNANFENAIFHRKVSIFAKMTGPIAPNFRQKMRKTILHKKSFEPRGSPEKKVLLPQTKKKRKNRFAPS